MHNMLGSAGMLRGWTAIWTMQMWWLLVTMTVCVGSIAMAELIMAARARRAQVNAVSLIGHTATSGHEQPFG